MSEQQKKKTVQEKSTGVQSLQKALRILEVFTIEEPQLSITDISNKVGLPRPTVTRLISTLEESGYVFRKPDNRKYTLGIKLCRLGSIAQMSWEIKSVALPILRELKDRFKETVYIDIVDGLERLCILSLEGSRSLRTIVPVGQRSPLYAGADGRILLAYQPNQTLEKVINKNNLKAKTDRTINDPELLIKELSKIRQDGYAISYGEWILGSIAISAPIKDHEGNVIASISMSVPDLRIDEENKGCFINAIKEAAVKISKIIG